MFDPYAGTGSILVAAAHLGAQTLGCDIDMRVIRDGKQVQVPAWEVDIDLCMRQAGMGLWGCRIDIWGFWVGAKVHRPASTRPTTD